MQSLDHYLSILRIKIEDILLIRKLPLFRKPRTFKNWSVCYTNEKPLIQKFI